MKRVTRLITFVLLLACTTGLEAQVEVADQAPEYLGVAANGNAVFRNHFEGQVVVVTFWASWCPPCMEELPALNRLARRFGERLTVLAVSFDDSPADRAYVRRHASAYRLFFINDPNHVVRKRFAVSAIPHLFVIGPDGMVTMSKRGYDKSAIRSIMAEIQQELEG
ncbi:MAG: TlpA disulfide reductase family protein [Pseudomonadota bacterium]